MQTIRIANSNELTEALARLASTHLFRGQVQHYEGKDGFDGFPTSFSRHGCVPSLMRKWNCYARDTLASYSSARKGDVDLAFSQAVLQHYGWRSFFVDLTADFGLACWFAANRCIVERQISVGDDANELGVLVAQQYARYEPHEGEGHVYAVDKEALSGAEIGLYDLGAFFENLPSRPRSQKAFLAGPKPVLPAACVSHLFIVPVSVLMAVAHKAGFRVTEDAFPAPQNDDVLRCLLNGPWVARKAEGHEFYSHCLDLPVYYEHARYIPGVFYRPQWGGRDLVCSDGKSGPLSVGMAILAPEEILYGYNADLETIALPKLRALLAEVKCVVVEADGVYRFPTMQDSGSCLKGVVIEDDGDRIDISEFTLEMMGSVASGFDVNVGYSYEWREDDCLRRSASKMDCTCGLELRHTRHLEILFCAEELLAEVDAWVSDGERLLRHRRVPAVPFGSGHLRFAGNG
ncbi:MAG: hypothetical protein H6832_09370 [Planctomycetes bacterium]|nr:hypothetical protein [Planctomycetota bacterium]